MCNSNDRLDRLPIEEPIMFDEGRRCAYCGRKLKDGRGRGQRARFMKTVRSCDHLWPRTLGNGSPWLQHPFNKVICCVSCNDRKNGRHPGLFLEANDKWPAGIAEEFARRVQVLEAFFGQPLQQEEAA